MWNDVVGVQFLYGPAACPFGPVDGRTYGRGVTGACKPVNKCLKCSAFMFQLSSCRSMSRAVEAGKLPGRWQRVDSAAGACCFLLLNAAMSSS